MVTKHVKTSTAQAKMLNNMENFNWFFQIAKFAFFRYNQIDVNIGVDEITVRWASNSAFDAHQTVFFCALEHGFRFQNFRMAWIIDIGADPTNVFATSESPLTQAIATHVKTLRTAAPQKYEATMCRNFVYIKRLDLIPIPKHWLLCTSNAQCTSTTEIFLQNWHELNHLHAQLVKRNIR